MAQPQTNFQSHRSYFLRFACQLTLVVALQHQIVGLLPQVLAREQICEVLVLLVHGVVHVHGDEHAGRGGLRGRRGARDGRAPAADGQLAAAVARGLAAHGADGAGGGRGRGQRGGRALAPQGLAQLVRLDRLVVLERWVA